jgi:hypothetical protein
MLGSEGGNKMKKELQTVRMGVPGGEIFSPPLSLLYFIATEDTENTEEKKIKNN